MQKFGYFAMLVFTIFGSFWLEIFIKVKVLKRIKLVLKAIAPVALLFLFWDAYAIHSRHWHFDVKQIIGIYGPGRIPIEEYLFFLIVPIAAIMTIEAVVKVRKQYGDEL